MIFLRLQIKTATFIFKNVSQNKYISEEGHTEVFCSERLVSAVATEEVGGGADRDSLWELGWQQTEQEIEHAALWWIQMLN